MAINKVEYNGTTLIDLTGNTVTADKLMAGETATDRSGEQITGTVVDSGHAWQDSDGYVHLDDDVGTKADVSDTTATPSTVLDGEIFYNSAGVRSVGTVTVPTKLSDLTNDLAVSDFQNDAGYLTSYTETDPNISAWARASSKPSYTASEVGAVPTTRTVNGKALSSNISLSASDVGALADSTSIPSKTSDLTNDSGFITASALPTVNNATLTIQKNGTTVKTFTANASSNVTANITVPTAVSDLTNDSGYITASDNFTGATASAGGADGTVPAPSTASAVNLTRTFLSAMGEWRRLSATFGTDATSATLNIRSYTEDGSSSSLLTTTLSAVSANTAGVMTATDKTNLDNGYIQFDATATSGDDYDLATALTALGWLSDVVV